MMADAAMDLDTEPANVANGQAGPAHSEDETVQVLSVLSQLKRFNLEAKVSFPQIVVCGQQSSGKSSLLESICAVPFPQSANVCTRFATQLCLQTTSEAQLLSAIIIPHPETDFLQRQRLLQFRRQEERPERAGLAKLMKEAAREMGIEGSGMSRHTLQLTLRGPDLPNLTLIDLPGIFCGSSEQQSLDDGEIVKQLVRDHLENPANTVLAVISADRSIADQTIPAMIKGTPTANRTLGVVTKADTINEEVNEGLVDGHIAAVFRANSSMKTDLFGLGWHVVCNRASNQKDMTDEAHHMNEARSIANGPFCKLPPERKGTSQLIQFVLRLQRDCILQALPGLRTQVASALRQCHQQLLQLQATAGPADARRKLNQVIRPSRTALQQSLQGTPQQRLFRNQPEANIRGRLEEAVNFFVHTLSERGQRFHVHDDDDLPAGSEVTADFWALDNDVDLNQSAKAPHLNRRAVLDVVLHLVAKQRAVSRTQGSFDHAITQALFRFQCGPWSLIADELMANVSGYIEQGLRLIVDKTCNNDAGLVWELLVQPSLQKLRVELKNYCRDRMDGIFEEQPQLSTADTTCISSARSGELKRMWRLYWAGAKQPPDPSTMLDVFLTASPDLTDRMVAAEVLACMESLYSRRKRRLEDDFTVQALMLKLKSLEDIFEPAVIDDIPDEQLSHGDSAHPELRAIEEKLESLRQADDVLRQTPDSARGGKVRFTSPRETSTLRKSPAIFPRSPQATKRKLDLEVMSSHDRDEWGRWAKQARLGGTDRGSRALYEDEDEGEDEGKGGSVQE